MLKQSELERLIIPDVVGHISGISDTYTAELISDFEVYGSKTPSFFNVGERKEDKAFIEIKPPPAIEAATERFRKANKIERIITKRRIPAKTITNPYKSKIGEAESGSRLEMQFKVDHQRIDFTLEAGSYIPRSLTESDANKLQDTLWWIGKCERMCILFHQAPIGFEFDLEKIVQNWRSRSGLVSAQKEDLPHFLAIYQGISSGNTKILNEFDFFMRDYYLRISLERDAITREKVDLESWMVAAAIAISEGMPQNIISKIYAMRGGEGKKVNQFIRSLRGRSDSNDLSPLYGENAPIVGRIAMSQFIYQRTQALEAEYSNENARITRVLSEVIVLMSLCISPQDTETLTICAMKDEELKSLIDETYGLV